MKSPVRRLTVDLGAYPDLVVVYLGMRVNAWRGLLTLAGIGRHLQAASAARPEGLLHADHNILFSLFPCHVGMRWYWRDFESMEAWTRSEPHRRWWQDFMKDSRGTGFWHETYCMRGGIEGVFDDLGSRPVGLAVFAPQVPAHGRRFSARQRLGLDGDGPAPPPGTSARELDADGP